MCEQCCAATITWPNVLPGWHLVRARRDGHEMKVRQWGLLRCNNPEFIWSTTPEKDGDSFNDLAKDQADHYKFIAAFNKFQEEFGGTLSSSKALGDAIKEQDPYQEGSLEYWLFNHLGKFIRENKPEIDNDVMNFGNNDPLDNTVHIID